MIINGFWWNFHYSLIFNVTQNNWLNFVGDSDQHMDLGIQYKGNKMHCCLSALSECVSSYIKISHNI